MYESGFIFSFVIKLRALIKRPKTRKSHIMLQRFIPMALMAVIS